MLFYQSLDAIDCSVLIKSPQNEVLALGLVAGDRKLLLEDAWMYIRIVMLSCFSRVQLFATLMTVDCQAPLSVGFSRQGYWSGLPCPSPGDLPDPGTEPMPLTSPALVGKFFTTSATWEAENLSSDIIELVKMAFNRKNDS